ncbi:hypothetical protein [Macrococcus sp. DPC7161]|uniref:hypothetical protein n=1 Tax=Macrococcus sp. DPC7161 TaxID=2507060 RepID=UPI00100B31E9|nr:hypothetical protein [Macrococcus sp. DPC7161]RXK18513.1 hypothetical protein ER639_04355 [Macrococcus sp. DPC7161]
MVLKQFFRWILEDETSVGIDPYPESIIVEKGVISDAKNRLITVDAHVNDIEPIFINLLKDKKFHSVIDGYGAYVDIENLDFSEEVEQGYFLTVLLDNQNEPILIWDPIVGRLSYHPSITSYIRCSDSELSPPYLLPVKQHEMLIVGQIMYSGNDAYLLEMDDEYRALLMIKMMQPKQSIFIKGKTLIDYLKTNHIKHREKCNHILFDYPLDINVIKELMDCTCFDGHYNVQGIYFLDEHLDLDTVHFQPVRNSFVVDIKNEKSFYISTSSDESYAFNLNI